MWDESKRSSAKVRILDSTLGGQTLLVCRQQVPWESTKTSATTSSHSQKDWLYSDTDILGDNIAHDRSNVTKWQDCRALCEAHAGYAAFSFDGRGTGVCKRNEAQGAFYNQIPFADKVRCLQKDGPLSLERVSGSTILKKGNDMLKGKFAWARINKKIKAILPPRSKDGEVNSDDND